MELFERIYYSVTNPFPGIYMQDSGSLGDADLFKNSTVNSDILVWVLVTLALIIFGLVYGMHRYNKWKKFKLFEDEMRALDLNPDDESTFAGMVKRFALEEPVNVLMSARLFDEMATKEIEKVLGSAGSKTSKEHFIKQVYRIRTKTYHPDWLREPDELRSKELAVPAHNSEGEMAVS